MRAGRRAGETRSGVRTDEAARIIRILGYLLLFPFLQSSWVSTRSAAGGRSLGYAILVGEVLVYLSWAMINPGPLISGRERECNVFVSQGTSHGWRGIIGPERGSPECRRAAGETRPSRTRPPFSTNQAYQWVDTMSFLRASMTSNSQI